MSKPREFWIGIDENGFARWMSANEQFQFVDKNYACKEKLHVREVIEISEAEIAEANIKSFDQVASTFYSSDSEWTIERVKRGWHQGFEAGFRAAIAKLTGGSK